MRFFTVLAALFVLASASGPKITHKVFFDVSFSLKIIFVLRRSLRLKLAVKQKADLFSDFMEKSFLKP
jgi:hypothetical protein